MYKCVQALHSIRCETFDKKKPLGPAGRTATEPRPRAIAVLPLARPRGSLITVLGPVLGSQRTAERIVSNLNSAICFFRLVLPSLTSDTVLV